MLDTKFGSNQSFYKRHWKPGSDCRTCNTFYVYGRRRSAVGAGSTQVVG